MSGSAVSHESSAALLLVDGDILVRHALAQYLRDCGYRVVEAATSDEALAVLGTPSLVIDVVLAHARCPGSMDGFTLARHIRAAWPGMGVALAGSADRAAEEAARLCDEGPGLGRPYDHRLVLDRIKRLLAARTRSSGG